MRKKPTRRPRAGCLGTCLTRLMLMMIVAGIAAIILLGIKLSREKVITLDLSPERAVYGAPVLLPPGGLLVITGKAGKPDRYLTYLNRPALDVRWTSPALGEDSEAITIAAGGGAIYVAYRHHLMALDPADGDTLWEIILSADLESACQGCLQAADGVVIALTADGILHSIDSNTGLPRWQNPLDSAPRRLMLIQDHPAVIDTLPDGTASVLKLFDPASGSVVRQIEPRCAAENGEETLNSFSPMFYNPADQSVIFLFGGTLRSCAQRWDGASGQVLWESSVETTQAGSPRSGFDAGSLLLAGDTLIYAAENGEGDQTLSTLLAVDTLGGATRQVIQSTDYTLTPLAVQDQRLIAHAARTHGTARDELWGIDPASGAVGWRYMLDAANESWAVHPASGGFMVIQMLPAPDRIVIERLDPRTGSLLNRTAQTVPGGLWSGTTWSSGAVWLAIHDLIEVDLATGEARIVWP